MTSFSNLIQYHNDISFLQLQLVICFRLVVKHDLATVCHLREAERSPPL